MPSKPYDGVMKEMPTNEKELARALANLIEDFELAHTDLFTDEMRELFIQLNRTALGIED